jgi:hypothetical protein
MAKEKKVQDSAPVEAAKPAPKVSTKPPKIPKLLKKNKTRLPRKQKKAAQKAARQTKVM